LECGSLSVQAWTDGGKPPQSKVGETAMDYTDYRDWEREFREGEFRERTGKRREN